MAAQKEYLRAEHTFVDYDERLDAMTEDSVALHDQGLYFLRQEYFRCRDLGWTEKPKYPAKFDLYELVIPTDAFQKSKLDINVKKMSIAQARDEWTAWTKAKEDYKVHPEKYTGEPKMPRYIYRKDQHNVVSIDKTRFRGNDADKITLPCSDYKVHIPSNIKKEWIVMLKIRFTNNNKFKITFIYDRNLKYIDELKKNKVKEQPVLSDKKSLGIDLGVKNLMTCVTFGLEKEASFIIRGSELKQKINETNDAISRLQSCALDSKNKELTKVSKKDNQLKLIHLSIQMADLLQEYDNFKYNYIHNVSSMIRDYCLTEEIKIVVIGHNEFWKQDSNIGTDNNRIFCSIPYSELISKLKYKLKEVGIELIEVEESYTSKCDHLALETMEHHDSYLGKRTKRGLFKSSTGKLMNADCNGAVGILRKANVIQDSALSRLLDRGDVVSPCVLNVRGFNRRLRASTNV